MRYSASARAALGKSVASQNLRTPPLFWLHILGNPYLVILEPRDMDAFQGLDHEQALFSPPA